MKKMISRVAMTVLFGVAAMLTVSCGGGSKSGGGSGSVKVSKNEFLGTIPSLYANYGAEKEAVDTRLKTEYWTLYNDGKTEKAEELKKESEAKLEELKTKFKTDLDAEIKAVIGRDVPVVISAALKNSGELLFSVESPTKLTESQYSDQFYTGPGAVLKISATGDKIGGTAYYQFVTTDGTVLDSGSLTLKEGERLIDVGPRGFSEPELWVDFERIEFRTFDEWSAGSKERLERLKSK
jgi:hypothetical protein